MYGAMSFQKWEQFSVSLARTCDPYITAHNRAWLRSNDLLCISTETRLYVERSKDKTKQNDTFENRLCTSEDSLQGKFLYTKNAVFPYDKDICRFCATFRIVFI